MQRISAMPLLALLSLTSCDDCRPCACNTCYWSYALPAGEDRSIRLSQPTDRLSECAERSERFSPRIHTILGRVSASSPLAVDLETAWSGDERSTRCPGARTFASPEEALAAADLQVGDPVCIVASVRAVNEGCTLVSCECLLRQASHAPISAAVEIQV